MRDEIRAGFPDGAMYGGFGGSYIPENLEPVMDEIAREYEKCRADASFKEEYLRLLKEYVGRPSALTWILRSKDPSIPQVMKFCSAANEPTVTTASPFIEMRYFISAVLA